MNIRKGVQKWAEIVYTFDGQYVRDPYGNVAYTIEGNYIRMGYGGYGSIKYTISGNCIYDYGGATVRYSIHGDKVVEGSQPWGDIVYNLDF